MAQSLPKIPDFTGKNYQLKFEALSTVGNDSHTKVLTDGQIVYDNTDWLNLLQYTHFYPDKGNGSKTEDRKIIYDRRAHLLYKTNTDIGECKILNSYILGDINVTFPDNFTINHYSLFFDTAGYDYVGLVSENTNSI